MRRIVPVIALVMLVSVAAAQDAIKKEMRQLEGEWSMVSVLDFTSGQMVLRPASSKRSLRSRTGRYLACVSCRRMAR
jgi:hypothetical protein